MNQATPPWLLAGCGSPMSALFWDFAEVTISAEIATRMASRIMSRACKAFPDRTAQVWLTIYIAQHRTRYMKPPGSREVSSRARRKYHRDSRFEEPGMGEGNQSPSAKSRVLHYVSGLFRELLQEFDNRSSLFTAFFSMRHER